LDATTVSTGVTLHDDTDFHAVASDCIGKAPNGDRRIRGDGHFRPARERGQTIEFRFTDDVVGNENVVKARIHHLLCFADLLADNADRAGFDLHFRDFGNLVCLRVNTEWDVEPVTLFLRLSDVLLEDVEIDRQCGRIEIVDCHFRSL
tara:strand:- start:131 stop:574 length:444 start_codon:yes stop_codon:yes gene_type:complete